MTLRSAGTFSGKRTFVPPEEKTPRRNSNASDVTCHRCSSTRFCQFVQHSECRCHVGFMAGGRESGGRRSHHHGFDPLPAVSPPPSRAARLEPRLPSRGCDLWSAAAPWWRGNSRRAPRPDRRNDSRRAPRQDRRNSSRANDNQVWHHDSKRRDDDSQRRDDRRGDEDQPGSAQGGPGGPGCSESSARGAGREAIANSF